MFSTRTLQISCWVGEPIPDAVRLMGMSSWLVPLVVAVALGGCSHPSPDRSAAPAPGEGRGALIKPRYIPIQEAVKRLAPHVDVPEDLALLADRHMILLAESMERRSLEALDHARSC